MMHGQPWDTTCCYTEKRERTGLNGKNLSSHSLLEDEGDGGAVDDGRSMMMMTTTNGLHSISKLLMHMQSYALLKKFPLIH